MEWVLLGLAGLGAATWGGIRIRGRRASRRERADALAQVVKLCEEDELSVRQVAYFQRGAMTSLLGEKAFLDSAAVSPRLQGDFLNQGRL